MKYIKNDGIKKSKQQMYAERIKATERIRIDINKSDNIFHIADLALLGMSLMLDDSTFYKENKDKLINIIANWETKENL